jgi:hypothetical protein
MMSFVKAGLVAAALSAAAPVAAQDVVYRPVSPTFGGNPFNSNHVLGVANANNNTRDPRAATSNSQADIFARQLQSRLLRCPHRACARDAAICLECVSLLQSVNSPKAKIMQQSIDSGKQKRIRILFFIRCVPVARKPFY